LLAVADLQNIVGSGGVREVKLFGRPFGYDRNRGSGRKPMVFCPAVVIDLNRDMSAPMAMYVFVSS
jgi:hypothetical protein